MFCFRPFKTPEEQQKFTKCKLEYYIEQLKHPIPLLATSDYEEIIEDYKNLIIKLKTINESNAKDPTNKKYLLNPKVHPSYGLVYPKVYPSQLQVSNRKLKKKVLGQVDFTFYRNKSFLCSIYSKLVFSEMFQSGRKSRM